MCIYSSTEARCSRVLTILYHNMLTETLMNTVMHSETLSFCTYSII